MAVEHGWGERTRILSVGHMGCYAALPALATAADVRVWDCRQVEAADVAAARDTVVRSVHGWRAAARPRSASVGRASMAAVRLEEQQTLALVVDEYGDVQGMVSANDLLSAVLGRVQDTESAPEEALVVTRADGSYLVDGRLSTEELRELLSLVRLPDEDDGDYHTAAGMVIAQFGRIPHSGEFFEWSGWRFEVVDLDGARIDKLLVARLPEPEREDGI